MIVVTAGCQQTEIAKRLNAICAQVIPFLSQEVSVVSKCCLPQLLFCCLKVVQIHCGISILIVHPLYGNGAITLSLASAAGRSCSGASQAGHNDRAECHYGGEGVCGCVGVGVWVS